MNPPSDVLNTLRNHTREAQQRLEGRLGFAQASHSVRAYRAFLTRYYGFLAPAEARLEAYGYWDMFDINVAARRKQALIEADLFSVGVNAQTLARSQAIAPLVSAEQALGLLFVFENFALACNVLAPFIALHLSNYGSVSFRFLDGYGANTGEMWADLRLRYADAAIRGLVDCEKLVDRSLEYYDAFSEWATHGSTA